jgi:glycosyltransferase involved in cell wall biosynthesis
VRSLPRVSVLVPARNEESNLPRLIRSFRAQNHPDAELILYDDQSEDSTWEIIQHYSSTRIKGMKGGPLPDGWVGKVNGCYQLSLQASGEVFLFLDADTEFLSPSALKTMCTRFESRTPSTILTGMTLLKGKGQLIVSFVGNFILSAIPWWLASKIPFSFMSGVNGQCWMITAKNYREFEPHVQVKSEVLEDVMIGRYLHKCGLIPVLDDVRSELAVHMYSSFSDAWKGFRKNVAFMLGGSAVTSLLMLSVLGALFIYAPILSLWFLLPMYLVKGITDRMTKQSILITLLSPVSYLLAIVLGLDSILTRSLGRIQWKGRSIEKSK